MARGDDDYRFLPLVDAISAVNQRVNVVGVVVESNLPRQSKGTDFFCTVKIIDQSYSSPGLVISCFERNMENLPHVESAGDIIFFSRILQVLSLLERGELCYSRMQSHCGEVNATFNKSYSTFAIFEGKHGTQLLPYQASAKFHPRDQDNMLLVCLRKWLLDHQLNEGLKDYLLLKEIRVGEHLTLLCKVLHVCKVSENEWMAFVWDGTDAPPVTMIAKHGNEFEKPPPLQLEPFPLPRDVMLKFPTIGTIVRMVMENDSQSLRLLKCDRWVKLIKVTCDHHAGLWRCMLMHFSKLQYLPNTEPVISQTERYYEERISLNRRMQISGCSYMTETDYRKMPFVTLMDVITYPEVTCKFRCAVRVISFFPFRTEDFCSPQGTYRLMLTLEDSTARIYAFLYAEDGEKFFSGYPSDEELKRKRNTLLGVTAQSVCSSEDEIQCAPRSPPWVECCLKSYYTDKQNKWGTRKYRIFATKVR